MGRSTSPQGLTASDFHRQQPFVNPLDVFPARKSRFVNRASNYRSPIRGQAASRSPSRFVSESHKFACCGEEERSACCPSSALSCCVGRDEDCDEQQLAGAGYRAISGDRHETLLTPHSSPSPMDCEDCVDDCEDCVEEHQKFNLRDDGYLDDCEECHEEGIIGNRNDHSGCRQDTCDECDFSCFDCIDWNEFDCDKSPDLPFSVPLQEHQQHGHEYGGAPETPAGDAADLWNFQSPDFPVLTPEVMAPPLDVPMHHQCIASTVPFWTNVAQGQFCTGDPGWAHHQQQQLPLPPFGLEYGCHPAAAHQQQIHPLSTFQPQDPNAALPDSMNLTPTAPAVDRQPSRPPLLQSSSAGKGEPLQNTQDLLSAVTHPSTSQACQWLMPCGTVCGASFASAADLKKHMKAVHLVKGVTKCGWQDCDSVSIEFASEAALTGHLSKKHLAPLMVAASAASVNADLHHGATTTADGGPFKCTFPGCPKSFMYKQVRDEHVASCHNGNKMYCHICGQYLNGEGSNFKRHMATHRPKHQHTLCKFHALGCKRRFPRLDNLRRHEACCKFGKRAAAALANADATATATATDAKKHHHHQRVHHAHTSTKS